MNESLEEFRKRYQDHKDKMEKAIDEASGTLDKDKWKKVIELDLSFPSLFERKPKKRKKR